MPAIFLLGPTASGKSACALEIARRLPCEIVSVDSAAVYRGMVMNHLIHHRAQLGRDLRTLGAPIPGMYGPSADEG